VGRQSCPGLLACSLSGGLGVLSAVPLSGAFARGAEHGARSPYVGHSDGACQSRKLLRARQSTVVVDARGDLAPAKCNLVAPVACVQGYAGGTGVHSEYAASETRNRSRTAFPHVRHCFQGGAEGIRTPDLLIAKGCRRGQAPSFSVDHVAFVSGVCVGCDFGGHRGAPRRANARLARQIQKRGRGSETLGDKDGIMDIEYTAIYPCPPGRWIARSRRVRTGRPQPS